MKRYNEKLVAAIEKICLEKAEEVNLVGPEWYRNFIDISEKGMEILIAAIVADRSDYINHKVFSEEGMDDEEIYDLIMLFLELIAEGKVLFREKDHKICFYKAIGPKPSEVMEFRIEQKIESSKPIITRVFQKILTK